MPRAQTWAAWSLTLLLGACAKEQDDFAHYRDLLRDYSEYGDGQSESVGFVYQSNDQEELTRLREKYDLTTIAGDGDEISQIMSLMLWVNENIRHDGGAPRVSPPNADNIIETSLREDRGFSCRTVATVLNDFYLAVGFPSRLVTAKPMEHDFVDCHVVNAVYSTQLGKWVMMDSSFAGYFLDEQGTLLGPSEVRQRFVDGDPVDVSPHLNHNGERYYGYKEYMAKNLFRLECPEQSAYNYEAQSRRTYVELIPEDYEPESFSNYLYTTDRTAFWAAP